MMITFTTFIAHLQTVPFSLYTLPFKCGTVGSNASEAGSEEFSSPSSLPVKDYVVIKIYAENTAQFAIKSHQLHT
jgi:hypothetical protein